MGNQGWDRFPLCSKSRPGQVTTRFPALPINLVALALLVPAVLVAALAWAQLAVVQSGLERLQSGPAGAAPLLAADRNASARAGLRLPGGSARPRGSG